MAITLNISDFVQNEFLDDIDSGLEPHLRRSFWVRNKTLDCCYSIREYEFLPEDVKDDVYNVINGLVEQLAAAYGQIGRFNKED